MSPVRNQYWNSSSSLEIVRKVTGLFFAPPSDCEGIISNCMIHATCFAMLQESSDLKGGFGHAPEEASQNMGSGLERIADSKVTCW